MQNELVIITATDWTFLGYQVDASAPIPLMQGEIYGRLVSEDDTSMIVAHQYFETEGQMRHVSAIPKANIVSVRRFPIVETLFSESKAVEIPLTLNLTLSEFDTLEALAEQELRAPEAHALYMLRQELKCRSLDVPEEMINDTHASTSGHLSRTLYAGEINTTGKSYDDFLAKISFGKACASDETFTYYASWPSQPATLPTHDNIYAIKPVHVHDTGKVESQAA